MFVPSKSHGYMNKSHAAVGYTCPGCFFSRSAQDLLAPPHNRNHTIRRQRWRYPPRIRDGIEFRGVLNSGDNRWRICIDTNRHVVCLRMCEKRHGGAARAWAAHTLGTCQACTVGGQRWQCQSGQKPPTLRYCCPQRCIRPDDSVPKC